MNDFDASLAMDVTALSKWPGFMKKIVGGGMGYSWDEAISSTSDLVVPERSVNGPPIKVPSHSLTFFHMI